MLNQFFQDSSINMIFFMLLIAFVIAIIIQFKLMKHFSFIELLYLVGFILIFIFACTGFMNNILFAIAIIVIAFTIFLQIKDKDGESNNV